jgi:hypothetical protein
VTGGYRAKSIFHIEGDALIPVLPVNRGCDTVSSNYIGQSSTTQARMTSRPGFAVCEQLQAHAGSPAWTSGESSIPGRSRLRESARGGFMPDKSTEVVDLEFVIACTLVGITALLFLGNYLSSIS